MPFRKSYCLTTINVILKDRSDVVFIWQSYLTNKNISHRDCNSESENVSLYEQVVDRFLLSSIVGVGIEKLGYATGIRSHKEFNVLHIIYDYFLYIDIVTTRGYIKHVLSK